MRVIARDKCYVNGVLRRAGTEFEYDGPLNRDGSLPKYLVPADAEARKELANAHEIQLKRDVEAAKASAGPKRDGDSAVKVQIQGVDALL